MRQPMPHPKSNPPTFEHAPVRLRPIREGDEAVLVETATMETFRYYVTGMPTEETVKGFRPFAQFLLNEPSVQCFVVEDLATGKALGATSLMDIRPADRHVEIGMTWYTPDARGTQVNPACKFLLLQYAFEVLDAEKVTLKCDARNAHSRAAISKLGAEFEGILKRHRFNAYGEFRDTAFYAIFREMWPQVKEGLLARIG